jgi:hypothetical protein
LVIEFELKISSHIGGEIPKTVHVFLEFGIQQVVYLQAYTQGVFEEF